MERPSSEIDSGSVSVDLLLYLHGVSMPRRKRFIQCTTGAV